MIFRQLFDAESFTYSYLLASRHGGEALIIDSVLGRVDRYIQLLDELDLRLVKVVDTHVHADHITGMGALRDRTKCVTVMGDRSPADVVSMRVKHGETIDIEGISLEVIHTPGHTIDSYCFRLADRVFTGDTLLIRGTGRTDFQAGDPRDAYDSLFNKLLILPDETLVYPGHDYKGDTVSTIGEERAHNPRLQVRNADEYAEIMDNLNLPDPKQMDVAVPANIHIGAVQDAAGDAMAAWALHCEKLIGREGRDADLLVDLREDNERARDGVIAGSVHAPYTRLAQFIEPGGMLRQMASGKRLIFYCAYGERSALAVSAAMDGGLENVCHLVGGIQAWVLAGGAIEKVPGA
ncbi:MAG: MBL fold metallo-hydrolase [Proteobacteria bacterium]|nr:MBL fold metallo-hydrolase [Pseudomonadota bacterium]